MQILNIYKKSNKKSLSTLIHKGKTHLTSHLIGRGYIWRNDCMLSLMGCLQSTVNFGHDHDSSSACNTWLNKILIFKTNWLYDVSYIFIISLCALFFNVAYFQWLVNYFYKFLNNLNIEVHFHSIIINKISSPRSEFRLGRKGHFHHSRIKQPFAPGVSV